MGGFCIRMQPGRKPRLRRQRSEFYGCLRPHSERTSSPFRTRNVLFSSLRPASVPPNPCPPGPTLEAKNQGSQTRKALKFYGCLSPQARVSKKLLMKCSFSPITALPRVKRGGRQIDAKPGTHLEQHRVSADQHGPGQCREVALDGGSEHEV